MMTRQGPTTEAQAVRAFHQLLAACDMSPREYIKTLRKLAELAEELADDEIIAQRIYALQAMDETRRLDNC